MKIIGKHKDYFDYLVHQYGVDEKLVLDRRGIGEWKSEYNNSAVGGYNGITVDRDLLTKELVPRSGRFVPTGNDVYPNGRDYEVTTWLIVNGCGYPVVEINRFPSVYEIVNDSNSKVIKSWFGKTELFVSGTVVPEFIKLSTIVKRHAFIADYDCRDQWIIDGDVPILSKTGLASILEPQALYIQTVDFISENFVDKGEEISVQSDIQKVVSHGFDKKLSFRGKQ